MQNNVRNFVTAVLVLALSGHVHAMGFGSLDVQSNLGEPFKARVKLSDVSPDVGAECFKLVRSDASVPFASSVHIDHGAENSATLVIQGHKPVDEPILNLSLIATCSQDLNREYVVLLDPPAYNNEVNLPEVVSGNANVPDAHNKDNHPKAHHSAQPTTDEVVATGSANTPKKAKRKKKAKSPASSIRTDDAQPMYPQTIPVEPAVREEPTYAKPSKEVAKPTSSDAKLYISGATGEGIGPIALRLERTLSETPPSEDAPVDLTDEDVSDEVTAMTKQLSHLQSQIAALQKRNEELEKSSKEKIAKKPKEDESASRWLLYSLITFAVLAAIAIAEWVRRRKQRLELESSEMTPWVPDEISPTPNNTEAKLVANAVVEKSVANYTPPPSPIETEINDDILEQVEVFVAHGRANLAITLLQEYLRENPGRSPAAWLTLLDLFKREKMRVEYEEAAIECKRLFNVNVSAFDDPNETDNSRIDDYPEAKEQLEEVWGTPDELNKLNELAYNKRKEPREGFDKNAYLDVLLLRGIAQHRTQGDSSSTAHDDVTYTDDDRLFADDEIKPVDASDFPDLEVIDPETLTGTPIAEQSTTMPPAEGSAESKAVSNEIEFEMPNLDLPDLPEAKPASSPQSIIENAKNEIVKDTEEPPKLDKSAPLDFKL